MKFPAAVLVANRQPLVIEELEVPPLAYGQVLARVLCSGICGAQLGEIDGVKGPDKFLPHLLGHEATAEVVECGPGVRTIRPGERVVLHWRKGAGLEAPPPKYASRRGPVNAGAVTTFNQYAVVSENRATCLPADFDPESGAMMGCAVTTAFGALNNNAGVKIGESVVIWGAGGVGLNMVQGAVLAGAYPVVAVDLFDNRLELAARLGATHRINASRADVEAEARQIVGPDGADVVLENTGNPRVIEAAYRLTSPRGRTVLVGVPAADARASLYTLPLHFEKVLTGSHGGEARPDVDIPRYVRLCQAGRLDLRAIIGRRYPLDRINDAIADMRSGAVAGRCIIELP